MKYLALAALTSISAAELVWPSEYDHMEDLMYLQSGFNRLGFIDGILSCAFGQNEPGRQNTAEWIRTAYHDMATADAAAGTGGLDMSIMFETNRGENPGSAFNNTFSHLSGFQTIRSSGSDLLALAVVGSMSMCGGYDVPLRVGRIDATEAGPLGVPEPDQTLESHTAAFARQGFNQTEMIELVACGHTLGGVHNANFPQITGDSTEGGVAHFEHGESSSHFDNQVVTEYLENDTANVLVSGKSDTFNSDKRIFGADGNKTMQALSDLKYFQERCKVLMGRMIDTVPTGVKLSEPITPYEVKPYINLLALNSEGSIDFSGYIRVRYNTDKYPNADDLSAYLVYTDREGKNATTKVEGTRPMWEGGLGDGFPGMNFRYFDFTTTIPVETGISSFTIHVTNAATGTTEAYKNGGTGFPVQDKLLYQFKQSCQAYEGSNGKLTVTAAVREANGTASAAPSLHFASHINQGTQIDRLEVVKGDFVATNQTLAGYKIYEIKDFAINSDSDNTNYDIVLDETTKVEFQRNGNLEDCVPLIQ